MAEISPITDETVVKIGCDICAVPKTVILVVEKFTSHSRGQVIPSSSNELLGFFLIFGVVAQTWVFPFRLF